MTANRYRVVSVRQEPEYRERCIACLQSSWPEVSPVVYRDCVDNCMDSESPLPQWYLLECEGDIVGCAGLVTNDFVSRMDLWPWLCAVYVDEAHRGRRLSGLLIDRAREDALQFGFSRLYLTTDMTGFYEKFGFDYLAQGYHPWGDESRIYQTAL